MSDLIIGFTGSREGGSVRRREMLRDLLTILSGGKPFTFTHGDCIGWDEDAHMVARDLGASIIARPAYPIGHPMRAGCQAELILPERPPLARNQDIVDHCHELIAAPDGPETLRSGTWSTVRKARKAGHRVNFV